jgi:ferredoxin
MIARAFHAAEHGLDRLFGVDANPLRQLGAAGWWLFWAAVASGAYVYAFYDTGVATTYASVDRLSAAPRSLGGLMRSAHRYASDALVIVMALHVVRELALGRYRGFRWFTWTTGVPLIALVIASGAVGYWMVWDVLAQFVATTGAEWLGALPGFGPALVRNFVAPDAVTDRFFSLLAFAHIAVSLLLLLGMWIHVQRLAGAQLQPRAALGWGLAVTLTALALAVPAASQAPADLAHAPLVLAVDWFYLLPFVLADVVPPLPLWWAVLAATMLLFALPWLTRGRRLPVAAVNADECNGCGFCRDDCPYGAVRLVAAGDGIAARAQVLDALCAGCGICVGACPSATPFRSVPVLNSGIELPRLPVHALRERLDAALRDDPRSAVVAFGCDRGARVATLDGRVAAGMSLPCIGMLPPSFVDYALDRGAAVMIAGCASGDCEFRFGPAWLAARLDGTRAPHARLARHSPRVRIVDAVRDDAVLARELAAFRAALGDGHA